MNEKDGGAAFPRGAMRFDSEHPPTDGMSLRDYFAAQWLLGAALEWARSSSEELAKHAYELADAMLKERSK